MPARCDGQHQHERHHGQSRASQWHDRHLVLHGGERSRSHRLYNGSELFGNVSRSRTCEHDGSRCGAGGCTDTDNNSLDFTAGTPNPRNSSSPANSCSSGPSASHDHYDVAAAGHGQQRLLDNASGKRRQRHQDMVLQHAPQQPYAELLDRRSERNPDSRPVPPT